MKKRKNGFDPLSTKPFKLSRSKIELYHECPCCFYLDRKLGVTPPSGFPFNLNNAVDDLLKKEFDSYRERQLPHPLILREGIDAIPFRHDELVNWRMNQRGISFAHAATGFLVMGAVDDLWMTSQGDLVVVDYKATSKSEAVNIDAEWQLSYKRQMEVYQWLFRMNGFTVSSTGYFVYCNGKKDRPSFGARLDFDISLIPYQGNVGWIEPTLQKIHACLSSDSVPDSAPTCKLCQYRLSVQEVLQKA